MLASELIAILAAEIKKHGDLPIIYKEGLSDIPVYHSFKPLATSRKVAISNIGEEDMEIALELLPNWDGNIKTQPETQVAQVIVIGHGKCLSYLPHPGYRHE